MKKLLTIALVASLCTPAFAQKMGSTNRNAPALEQAITVNGAKMTLNYTAITWAGGEMMKSAMDKANGAGARESINKSAPKSPLGTFNTSVPVSCGDLKMEAGEYKLYYTITEACDWELNFQGKDDKVAKMKLPLMENHEESKRLLMCLYATDTGAGTYVAFGKQMCMLNFNPSTPAKAAK